MLVARWARLPQGGPRHGPPRLKSRARIVHRRAIPVADWLKGDEDRADQLTQLTPLTLCHVGTHASYSDVPARNANLWRRPWVTAFANAARRHATSTGTSTALGGATLDGATTFEEQPRSRAIGLPRGPSMRTLLACAAPLRAAKTSMVSRGSAGRRRRPNSPRGCSCPWGKLNR